CIDDCDAGVAQRGVNGQYTHCLILGSRVMRSTRKARALFDGTGPPNCATAMFKQGNRQIPEQQLYSRHHANGKDERQSN
ncbi:MAG: hypothetical protein DME50_17705, partial [Verrucomicrobia bacterium]